MVGATRVQKLAADVEVALATGRAGEIRERVEQLQFALAALTEGLRERLQSLRTPVGEPAVAPHSAELEATLEELDALLAKGDFAAGARYRDAAFAVNRYVRRTLKIDGPLETRGAIKGFFPVSGRYGTYQYLNWACKFFVDANMLELKVRQDKKV